LTDFRAPRTDPLVLLELEVGDAVAEQAADAIGALEDDDVVAGARELLRAGEPGRPLHRLSCTSDGSVGWDRRARAPARRRAGPAPSQTFVHLGRIRRMKGEPGRPLHRLSCT